MSFESSESSPTTDQIVFTKESTTKTNTKIIDHNHTISMATDYDPVLTTFLSAFAISPEIQNSVPIHNDIIEDNVTNGFKKWKESTSTSPSGRHLRHYKSIIQQPALLRCLTLFLDIATTKGIAVTRWKEAISIMIEKDAGKPKLNRLRIIHLFEADCNFFLKLQWGSRLVKRAMQKNLLHDGQHGSIPYRSTVDPIMLTQLSTDICRIQKHNIARFDNDASACYDRIIVPLGMMAARRCGMPDAIQTHADTLQNMKYKVKTIQGISAQHYAGTHDSPLLGTGQGSGASPAVWLSLVVIIMDAFDRLTKSSINF